MQEEIHRLLCAIWVPTAIAEVELTNAMQTSYHEMVVVVFVRFLWDLY
jgi:hypothetical protein